MDRVYLAVAAMTNAPAHAAEHDQLMQLLAKVTDRSQLIGAVILITIGCDGRPCVGSDLGFPGYDPQGVA